MKDGEEQRNHSIVAKRSLENLPTYIFQNTFVQMPRLTSMFKILLWELVIRKEEKGKQRSGSFVKRGK